MNSKTKRNCLKALMIISGLGFLVLYFYFYAQIKNHLKIEGQKQLMMLGYSVWTYCAPMLLGLFLSLPYLIKLGQRVPETTYKVTISIPFLLFTLFALLPVISILDYCYGLNMPLVISLKLTRLSSNYELYGVLFGYCVCHIWQKKSVNQDWTDTNS